MRFISGLIVLIEESCPTRKSNSHSDAALRISGKMNYKDLLV